MTVIKKLQINNFRNIENQLIEPSDNINIFIGDNAQGKTSLIEAIYYLGHNKSFKNKNFKNIVTNNKTKLSIQAIFNNKTIKILKTNEKTNITLNENKLSNSVSLTKELPIQLITPDKGFLVGGDKKTKRFYLDWGVFHVEHSFADIYKKYKKIQKNINILIFKNEKQQLEYWFKELATVSVLINNIKISYLNELKKININKYFNTSIVDIDKFEFEFNNGWLKTIENNEKKIFEFLISNIDSILKNKYLKYGPHLANINFYFDKKNEFQLSRGEQKTLSIIFWLTQVLYLKKINNQPIVLIDDLSSELDNNKIQEIINFLHKIQVQTFITSINSIKVSSDKNTYLIKNGKVEYNK